jgi:hypothetical protein
MQSNNESPNLLNVLRGAVQQVVESSGVAPDDPAIVELKNNMVRTVGELEVAKARRQDQGKGPTSVYELVEKCRNRVQSAW